MNAAEASAAHSHSSISTNIVDFTLSCSALKRRVYVRFGGASGLEEDRAARRLEVDEHGIARRLSDDVWSMSAATSRCDMYPCIT